MSGLHHFFSSAVGSAVAVPGQGCIVIEVEGSGAVCRGAAYEE